MPQLPTRNICYCIKWSRVASCGLCGGHTIFCCVVVTKAENNILNIISMIRGVPGRYVGGPGLPTWDMPVGQGTTYLPHGLRTAYAGTITFNIKIKQLMFVLHHN